MRPDLKTGIEIFFSKKPSFSHVRENEPYLIEKITSTGVWLKNLKRNESTATGHDNLRNAWWWLAA